MQRDSWHDWLNKQVRLVAERGTCSRLQVGAILVRDNRVVGSSYNGAASGLPHCVHTDDTPCEISTHAEANAIAFAARHGIRTEGADLILTHAPCLNCAKLIVNAGIARVRWIEEYRSNAGERLLASAGYCPPLWGNDEEWWVK